MTKVLRALALALLLAAPHALAQATDELSRLKEEQARLRQSLDDIDRRIRVLEGVPAAAPGNQPGTSLHVLRSKWSEIQPGTPKARVDAVLGAPEREMRINRDLVWYYVYPGIGRGSVFFSTEDKVTAVQPPAAGWSW